MSEHPSVAEQAVIGAILLEPELIKECSLQEEHFYEARHKIIFQTMRALEKSETPPDLVAVVTMLRDVLESVGGVAYLSDLMNAVATTSNFKHYEELILEHVRRRSAVKLTEQFYSEANDETIDTLITELQQIQELTIKKQHRTKKEILADVADTMHELTEDLTGRPSGIIDLDKMTGGWQKQDLIIVAARPSVGKTAFALHIGAVNCRKGGVTTFFSLEMADKQLAIRFINAEGRIDGVKWKNPTRFFSADDYQQAANAIGAIEKWDMEIIDNPSIKVSEIRSKLSEIKRRYPNREHLVIIDYLQLIQPSSKRGENRQQEVSDISRSLKAMARELDVPIIALSQLSRKVESRQVKRPMMSDIRESGSIEQDADIVAFLYRDDYYDHDTDQPNKVEIIVAKQRNGPVGTVEALFEKEYGRFVNLAKA
ncbi:replicative DNA helicase [Halalkalibacter wakoensis JCM 9140]|uniref:Replicative DNA helicase n=1 Tax=Halalkalibacter wakoensis JCM 9140 TaxID=1236970 RepID=W4Q6J0_9BACI|nr:replicative DNA helicase [Halalkalibacter wakoensis]GAE27617.1 replicative DNA helicase [Halalkalibacter wakoensis JCM 9140]